MSFATMVRVHRGFSEVMTREARAVCERAETVRGELEAFIDEEKRRTDAIGDLWKDFVDNAQDGDWQDFQEFAEAFRGLFDQADASLAALRQWLDRVRESTGKAPSNAEIVEQMARTLEDLKAKIVPELDWFTRPMEEPGPEFFDELEKMKKEGGFIDIQDIIRELQGNDPSNGSPADR